MELRSGNQFTIGNFCEQFDLDRIKVNPNYQRSPTIWSTAARSYLIETILKGFPIPKLIMRQRADIQNRRTELEIVDGQQRSVAIRDFFNGNLKISTGRWKGRRYEDLEDDDKITFVEYSIGYDVLVGATDEEVREVYRRINSYTTPLNRQEIRFATALGEEEAIKWFIFELAENTSEILRVSGVLTEKQISRMGDQELLAMFISFLVSGLYTAAPAKLDALYVDFDNAFPYRLETEERIRSFLNWFANENYLFETPLASREQFLSLGVAYTQCTRPTEALSNQGLPEAPLAEQPVIRENLFWLLEELQKAEEDEEYIERSEVRDFLIASKAGTNTLENRKTRALTFISALSRKLR